MNKGDLINEVAKSTCSKAEAGQAVKAVLETIKKSLKKDCFLPCFLFDSVFYLAAGMVLTDLIEKPQTGIHDIGIKLRPTMGAYFIKGLL